MGEGERGNHTAEGVLQLTDINRMEGKLTSDIKMWKYPEEVRGKQQKMKLG